MFPSKIDLNLTTRTIFSAALIASLFYYIDKYSYSVHSITIPVAERVPFTFELHNKTFIDEYLWLKNLNSDQRVKKYINAENELTDKYFHDSRKLSSQILESLRSGPTMTSISADCLPPHFTPEFWNFSGYNYWIEYTSGSKYPIYKRQKSTPDCACPFSATDTIQTVLDYTILIPSNSSFFRPGLFEVEPLKNEIVAYAIDTLGSEKFDLNFVDIQTQTVFLRKSIEGVYYSGRWQSAMGKTYFYYNTVDELYGIPWHVHKICVVGCRNDHLAELVFSGNDPSLTVEVLSSNDNKFLFIKEVGQVTSQLYLVLSIKGVIHTLPLFQKSIGVLYDVEHHEGYFYVLTNTQSNLNFFIFRISENLASLYSNTSLERIHLGQFEIIIPHSSSEMIEKMEMLKDTLALWIRLNGVRYLRLVNIKTFKVLYQSKIVDLKTPMGIFPSSVPDIYSRIYRTFDSKCILYSTSSYLEELTLYNLDTANLSNTNKLYTSLLKKIYDYTQKRIYVKTLDKTLIPLDLVYKTQLPMPRKVYMSAYGAYSTIDDPVFKSSYFALLDRGYIIAIVHPRGDGDMGSSHYTFGKYTEKENTFSDVGESMQYLIDQGYTSKKKIAFMGRSAGGLVAGNVLNKYHDRVGCIVAQVPFIDAIYDGIDILVPWTAFEWFEWGNPLNRSIFDVMLKYSPYQNVEYRPDVSILVTAGVEDLRVPFYEPLKWVAKMRYVRTKNIEKDQEILPILMRMRNFGHYSSSDGDEQYMDTVEKFVFVLNELK